jgi:hypothetical protein
MNDIAVLQIGKHAEKRDQSTVGTYMFRMLEFRLVGMTTTGTIQ